MTAKVTDIVHHPKEWSTAYVEEDRSHTCLVIDFLNDPRIRAEGWTQRTLARRAGVSQPTVAQVLRGKYPSSPSGHLKKILEVMSREIARREGGVADMPFVETSVHRLVLAACHRASLYRAFAVVSAYVGTGKTESLRHYAASHPNTIMVEATPSMSASVMLTELVAATAATVAKAKDSHQGTKASRMAGVVQALKDTETLIVLDEAETASPEALEYLRRISDRCRVGVVLTGTERLRPLVRDPRGRFGQVSSRVVFWPPVIRAITEQDCEALTRAGLGGEVELADEALDAFWQMCDGSARVLCNALIPGVRDYGLRKGHVLTADLVFRVGQDVLGFARPKGA